MSKPQKVTQEWILKSAKLGPLAVDTETVGTPYNGGHPFLVTFCNSKLEERYAFIGRAKGFKKRAPMTRVALRSLFRHIPHIVFHNCIFDVSMLRNLGIPLAFSQTRIDDTLVMAHLCNEQDQKKGLKVLAAKYLKEPPIEEDAIKPFHPKTRGYDSVPNELIIDYGCADARKTLKLWYLYHKTVEDRFAEVYETEMRTCETVIDMQKRGHAIDVDLCRRQAEKYHNKEMHHFYRLCKIVGTREFNPASPLQVRRVIYKKLALPVLKKTDKGASSTDEETLSKLPKHPFIKHLLAYRSAAKMRNTYYEPLADKSVDGVIHCSFNPTATRTHRFSSSNPNLQNIPKREFHGVRSVFICRPGYKNWYFDYSQIEMRIFAHYSGDESLLNALRAGADFHAATAEKVFGRADGVYRFLAKRINFGILFGIGAERMVDSIIAGYAAENIEGRPPTVGQAKEYIKTYHQEMPGVRELTGRCASQIAQLGHIKDIFGRVYRIPFALKYKGINAIVQGTAAGVIKEAMNGVHEYLSIGKHYYHGILLTVHDELCIEIAYGHEYRAKDIKLIMENFHQFKIDLPVDVSVTSTSWADKKKVEVQV